MELDTMTMTESVATGVEPSRPMPAATPDEWTSPDQLRLVVADESIVEALGMAAILGRFSDLRVVRHARGTQEALRVALEVNPDVVLVGLGLDPQAGLALLRELRAHVPQARLVAFSTVSNTALVRAAYTAGAVACVLRDDDPAKLHSVLQAAHAGHGTVVTDVRALLQPDGNGANETPADEVLTRREIEVLRLIADGRSSREIARQLGIRLATVNAHRASMMKKLNIHKAVGLAQYWLRKSPTVI